MPDVILKRLDHIDLKRPINQVVDVEEVIVECSPAYSSNLGQLRHRDAHKGLFSHELFQRAR